MAESSRMCATCFGTGEIGSEVGPGACPDCGGAGYLPGGEVLVDWRSRDIERAHSAPTDNAHADVAWLGEELRRARGALLAIYSLANEGDDSEISRAIRFEANRALGIHPIRPSE